MLFKRFLYIAIRILLFAYILHPITAVSNSLSEENVDSKIQNIQKELNNNPNLLETLLMVSKHWQPSLDTDPIKKEAKKLILSAQQKLKGVETPEKIIRILRTIVHDEGGYHYTDQVDERGVPINPEELFLHGLLNTRKGYCMTLSLLYLIIGQELDLPLYGVTVPNHFFVRYKKDKVQVNIETTEGGANYSDSFYRQRFGASAKNTYFMNNLKPRQTLGAYFSNVGMVYYQNQKPERAVFYLGLSTSINPESIDAQNNLANIYSELKKPQEAIKHYKLALKSDPENTSTLFNLGLVFQKTGYSTRAINTFLQIVQIDPAFKPSHQMLANLYRKNNRLISSLLHLKILARSQPRNLQNHLNLASAYGNMGQQKLAIETLKNVQTRFPANPKVREGLAEAYYRLEDFQTAIEQYRFLIDLDQTRLRNYVQLGWTYYRLRDLPMAAAWTLRGMKKSNETGRIKVLAQMNMAFYSLLEKKYGPAKKWYEKVLLENPPEISKGMIQDIEQAPAETPRRTDLQFFKGWIYFKSHQPEKSRLSLQTYLQMENSGLFSKEARDLLKMLILQKGNRFQNKSISEKNPEDMVLVPAGFFKMGSNGTLEDEAPEHRVYLDSYWIDKYEISATKFADFLNAVDNVKGYYLDNKFGTLFYDGRFHPRPGLEDYPINNVTWVAANEYCRWVKKRLPTEAEWEKAARGTTGQTHPWGNTPPSNSLARYFQTWSAENKHKVMVPVQALAEGQSPFGLYNMAGNVKEWVDDWYDREYYKEQSEYINPRGPIGGEFKVVRGGSWRDLKGFINSTFRNNGNPKSRMDDYGFRCVKNAGSVSQEKKLTKRKVPHNKG